MTQEKLNTIMNCQCLQTIVENDKNKHTINDKTKQTPDVNTIQNPVHNHIIFATITYYRHQEIHDKHGIITDTTKQDVGNIPFIFCPICGTKTKNNVHEKSYYAQFQKTINK